MPQVRLYKYTGPDDLVMYLENHESGKGLPNAFSGKFTLVRPRKFHVVSQTSLKEDLKEEGSPKEEEETKKKASVNKIIHSFLKNCPRSE